MPLTKVKASNIIPGEVITPSEQQTMTNKTLASPVVSGNMTFGDSDKAIFGAGSDLQIYHDGANSFIQDAGTGDLIVRAGNTLYLQSYTGAENYLTASTNGAVTLYYDNAAKLATTSTGIDVTGNITVTGTVDGRDVATDGTKLDGIEASADVTDSANVNPLIDGHLNYSTATSGQVLSYNGSDYAWVDQSSGQTASELLTEIKTVDGSGSGLDADLLDGVQGSGYLRSDSSDTATGIITFQNSSDYQIELNGNSTSYAGIKWTDVSSSDYMWFNGSTGTFAIGGGGSTVAGKKLHVDGGMSIGSTADATAMPTDGLYVQGNVQTGGEFQGTATSAQWADLAENYLADQSYPIGTVLEIGGEREVTIATKESYKIAGTVSEKPGFLMNSELVGEHVTPVSYIGRVPCRVEGVVEKGDMLVVGDTHGVAVARHPRDILPGQAVGKALESYSDSAEGLIEILVGRL